MWERTKAFLKGWKTVLLNLSAVMSTIVAGIAGIDLSTVFKEYGSKIVAGLALVNLALRAITDSPIFKKDKDQ